VVRLYPSLVVQLDQGAGRSAYLCRHVDCLRMAEKKNRLARALKVAVPLDIYQQLWQRLDLRAAGENQCGEMIKSV
jgi:uncharacterized protein